MMKKSFLYLSCLCSVGFGLEFGSMGNTSASMGGAGVALKASAWGLYYNPALLASDPRVKFGYSLGVGFKEHNLAEITKIDINNMENVAQSLISTFTNGTTTSAGEITEVVKTALSSVLTTAGQSPSGDVSQDLQTYLNSHTGSDYSDLANALITAVNNSTQLDQTQKDLLDNIAGSIDFGNLSFDSNSMLSNITIQKGGDSGLDKAVSDISTLQDILKDNNLSVVSQNGIALQLSGKTMNNTLGSLGVAYFGSLYANVSILADANRMRLIINGGNGYYELSDNGSSYSYKESTKDDYEKYSLIASLEGDSDAHKIVATSFLLSEIPIGYARTFYLKHGNVNVGIAGKFMNAISAQNAMNINKNTDFGKEIKQFASLDNTVSSNNFGIDVGLLYELDLPEYRYLTVGLVGKNLNAPTFKSTLYDVTIKPQYRMGLGYNSKFLKLAFDADLVPNDLIAFSNIKQQSQMIGGGVGLDLKLLDVRFGAMKDLKQDTGLILTAGVNVLGFLDIALQSSTKITKVDGTPIPQYLNLRIGGSFSF